jgi:prepilin-type N-terminal cleavage/methylation domain-containing protein
MPINSKKNKNGFTFLSSKKAKSLLDNFNKGFTLIEILITIAILALVLGISIPNLRRFNQDQGLAEGVSNIVQVLRQAQSNTMSGIRCSNGKPSSDWSIELMGTSYSFKALCDPQGIPTTETKIDNKPYNPDFPTAIFVDESSCTAADMTIIFSGNLVYAQCSVGSPTGSIFFKLEDSRSGSNNTITIGKTGVIYTQ